MEPQELVWPLRRRLGPALGRVSLQAGVSGEGQDLPSPKIELGDRPGTGQMSSEWRLALRLATGARPDKSEAGSCVSTASLGRVLMGPELRREDLSQQAKKALQSSY